MAKTNTDVIRDVSIEIAVHRYQIQNLSVADHARDEMFDQLRDRISERDVRDAFGHRRLVEPARALCGLIEDKLGLRARYDRLAKSLLTLDLLE